MSDLVGIAEDRSSRVVGYMTPLADLFSYVLTTENKRRLFHDNPRIICLTDLSFTENPLVYISFCEYVSSLKGNMHRRNQEIEMYTHTSGVDHEQGSLSLIWGGGSGVLPREKFDFRDGWRTILSLFHGRKFVFFQEIFIWNVHVSFTLRTCVACVMGVTPLI